MKKLALMATIILVGMSLQNCSSDDDEGHAEADGEISVVVNLHENEIETPVEGATVTLWFNKSSAEGTADYSGTTDATGLAEFHELENGVYFISATATVDGAEKSGNALAEVSEAVHDVEVEIDLE